MSNTDLEQAKKQYLAQWEHTGCGGQPVALPHYDALGCSLCDGRWAWPHTLGAAMQALEEAGIFQSLVLK